MSDSKTDKPTDSRSAQQIEADLAARRARMSANVEGLVTELHPKTIKMRTVDDAKEFLQEEVDNAKSQFKDKYGWRTDRLTLIGGVVVGAVVLLVGVRAIACHFVNKD